MLAGVVQLMAVLLALLDFPSVVVSLPLVQPVPLAGLAAELALRLPFFKNMMHMNYQYLYGGVEQHLLGK